MAKAMSPGLSVISISAVVSRSPVVVPGSFSFSVKLPDL